MSVLSSLRREGYPRAERENVAVAIGTATSSAHATPERIEDPWGERTPFGAGEEWPARVDLQLEDGLTEEDVESWHQAASLLHPNGDAMDIAVRDGRIVGVRGRVEDRVIRGRLGPKDLYGWQANSSPDRLTRPLIREDGELAETDWDTAMERVAGRSRELLDRPGGWGGSASTPRVSSFARSTARSE